MSRRLILIKHSLPEIIASSPPNRWRLSQQGRRRCLPLADELACYKPFVIFSSVEPKARETAGIISERIGVAAEISEGLHEQERSSVGWLERDEFERGIEALFRSPLELVFGDETAEAAYARIDRAVSLLIDKHNEGTLAIVSHGTVISLFVSRRTGCDALGLWRSLGLPSYVVLELPDFRLATVWSA